MKKILFYQLLTAIAMFLSGCTVPFSIEVIADNTPDDVAIEYTACGDGARFNDVQLPWSIEDKYHYCYECGAYIRVTACSQEAENLQVVIHADKLKEGLEPYDYEESTRNYMYNSYYCAEAVFYEYGD